MDMQNVARLMIPEGEVRTIHNNDSQLLWGRVNYSVKYKGNTVQDDVPTPSAPAAVRTVTGVNTLVISDGTKSLSVILNLGKNLFDGQAIKAWLRPNGTEVSSNGDRTSADYIAVNPNTTYTLHGTLSTYLKFTQYNSSKTAVSQQTTTSATSITVTTGATTAYIRIGWGNAANASNIQLECSSTATSYTPYFTPIELCKIGTYQDYIYKSSGKWYIHKEVEKVPGYAGESITTDYLSTTGALTTGAIVYYGVSATDVEITNIELVSRLNAAEQWLTRYGYDAQATGNLPIIIDRTAL